MFSSLSYAKRKTEELGLGNIEYVQADLLSLGTLPRTFDVIESSGVLHHLGDWAQGWRVLLSLLKPGGVMNVGLYSAIGRADFRARIFRIGDGVAQERRRAAPLSRYRRGAKLSAGREMTQDIRRRVVRAATACRYHADIRICAVSAGRSDPRAPRDGGSIRNTRRMVDSRQRVGRIHQLPGVERVGARRSWNATVAMDRQSGRRSDPLVL